MGDVPNEISSGATHTLNGYVKFKLENYANLFGKIKFIFKVSVNVVEF